jgi:hypothetical protein
MVLTTCATRLFTPRSGGGPADGCGGGEGIEPHDRAGGTVSGRSARAMMPPDHLEAN